MPFQQNNIIFQHVAKVFKILRVK